MGYGFPWMRIVENRATIAWRAGASRWRWDRGDRTLARCPTEIERRCGSARELACGNKVQLFGRGEADIAEVEVSRRAVEAGSERIANSEGDDTHACVRGVARGRGEVCAQIYAQNLSV